MRNIRGIVAYDGTAFCGWQIQPGMRTVQGELTEAFRRILGEQLHLIAASRTDSGVHARGQTVNIRTQNPLALDRLLKGINSGTADDVAVLALDEVAETFHSTRDALGKHYQYLLWLSEVNDPLLRYWHWWHRYPLDVERMQDAAQHLVGTRDFRGLQVSSGRPDESSIRSVASVALRREGARLVIDIHGRSFMYKQVRSMVGLLMAVGRGRVAVDEVPGLLTGDPARRRSEVAPAQGLTLMQVFYEHPLHCPVALV